MKQMLCLILIMALLLCGCQSAAIDSNHNTERDTGNVTEPAAGDEDSASIGIQNPEVTYHEYNKNKGDAGAQEGQYGCVRVEYTGHENSIRYITSVDQLPKIEALAVYDEAYFETKALVLVRETVSSGSVKVGIAFIKDGVVTLSHEMSGDMGTADMATWLLWAEVDAGLDYKWSVANPALSSNTHTH